MLVLYSGLNSYNLTFWRLFFNTHQEKHRVTVGPDVLQRFWMHWKQHRYPHPAADAAAEGGKLYTPIGISGDDAQYTLGGAKVIVMLLSFCLHEAKALELSRFPWFVLRHEYNLGPKTLDRPLRVLAWSLNVAFNGIFPSLGPFGDELSEARRKQASKPLAGGPFALVEIRGDWKWANEIFRFRRNYNPKLLHTCHFCDATHRAGPHQQLGRIYSIMFFFLDALQMQL